MSVLIAANADLIEIVVILIITALAGLGQFLAKFREKQPPAAAGAKPKPNPAQRPVPADVADEIENFLRRAQERRAGAKRPREVAPQADRPTRQPQRQPVPAEAVPAEAVPNEAVPNEVAELKPLDERVEDHVQRYLNEDEFTRRGTSMGKEVVDDVTRDIDQHLQQVFDHQLGDLGAGSAAAQAGSGPTASSQFAAPVAADSSGGIEWADLFANPDSMRQAIVLNEILTRPEHRWS